MPELDELMNVRKKDQQEFADAFDDVVGKTDEEIEKELIRSREADAASKAGVATKDLEKDTSESNYAFGKNADTETDTDGQQKAVATDTDQTDWKAKAETLEAELQKERQRTASWDGRIRVANDKAVAFEKENTELKAKLTEQSDAKTVDRDKTDKEKMDLFKENFPELGDFADIMQRKLDEVKTVPAAPAKVEPEPTYVAPVDPAPVDAGNDGHMDSIRKVHADVDEIASSGALLTWINTQPEFMRPGLRTIYNQGTANELVSMLTEFKTKSGWKSKVGTGSKVKQDKLDSMLETNSEGSGPKDLSGPDQQDFAGAAKEIGL